MLARAKLRVVACPAPHTFPRAPYGLRLSGRRKSVRCSRWLAAAAVLQLYCLAT